MSDPNVPPPQTPPPPVGYSSAGPIETDPNARQMGMIVHLLEFFAFLGPLIFWAITKEKNPPFVNRQAIMAMNWGLVVLAGYVIGVLTSWIFCIGVLLNVALFITNLVFVIINAMKANRGEEGSYPFGIPAFK